MDQLEAQARKILPTEISSYIDTGTSFQRLLRRSVEDLAKSHSHPTRIG